MALRRFTLAELDPLPVLSQGQADDLKVEGSDRSGPFRVWLSRCGVEDGEPFDHAVTVERFKGGAWVEVDRYPAKDAERWEAVQLLRGWLPEGSAVWTIVVHHSGRSWSVAPIIVRERPTGLELWEVSAYVARAIGRRWNDRQGGVVMQAGGMDVQAECVLDLARVLYGDHRALTHRRL